MKHRNYCSLVIAVLIMLIIWVFCFSAASGETQVEIGETNFPDAYFRDYVRQFDTNGNKHLSVKEISVVTSINVESKGVTSLKGIEYFTELTELDCSWNKLTKLDVSKNTALKTLKCYSNEELTNLDVSKNTALIHLACSNTKISKLDVTKNTALTYLDCSGTGITTINVSKNKALEYLGAENLKIESLDLKNNTALKVLRLMQDYFLPSLDVSRNTKLEILDAYRCGLETLDVSKNTQLVELTITMNKIKEIDLSHNPKLEVLNAYWSGCLEKLDLSHNKALKSLAVADEPLKELDLSNNPELESLWISETKLKSLDLGKNPKLQSLSCDGCELQELDISKNTKLKDLRCYLNEFTTLDVSNCSVLREIVCKNERAPREGVYDEGPFDYYPGNEWDEGLFVDPFVTVIAGNTISKPLDGYTDYVVISRTNFPDDTFREYVRQFDKDGNGVFNEEEIQAIKWIDVQEQNISTLKGIEFFTELNSINCNFNKLTDLDISKNLKLEELRCIENQLTSLDVSKNLKLKELKCDNNQLTSLDVSHNTNLIGLSCSGNQLTTIDLKKNLALEALEFGRNQITSVDISSNTKLKRIECFNNPLEKLDVSNCPVLVNLVSEKDPADYLYGFYGWWKGTPDDWPENCLFISHGLSVMTKAAEPEPADQVEAYIYRCYKVILGRLPDAGGLKTWYNELTSGRKTASEIIDRFVNSPEYINKHYNYGDSVDILYQAMLGRNADAGGKANWVKKLESGQTLAHVINGFCFSREFRGLCDSYGIRAGFVNIPNTDTTAEGKIKAFVQRCYRIILDREADPSGMQTWYEQLSSGKKAAAEIIDRFVNSPEFSGKNYSHSDSVEILYKAMLGRGSDAAGKANWVGKLDAGQPFAVVINGFCVSKEFTGICASYGIKPGNVNIRLSAQSEEELSMLALNAKAPITRRSETKPNRVEIINPSDTIDMNIGTAVQAVYINEEKAKEFIGRCYRVILGREASEAELTNWIGQMVNGTKTPDQIARGFLFSNEFKAKNVSSEELVKILYRVYMNREADPEGLATWTQKLNEGTSLQELLNTFSRTSEFKAVVKSMAN